jgi:hypothetical protein
VVIHDTDSDHVSSGGFLCCCRWAAGTGSVRGRQRTRLVSTSRARREHHRRPLWIQCMPEIGPDWRKGTQVPAYAPHPLRHRTRTFIILRRFATRPPDPESHPPRKPASTKCIEHGRRPGLPRWPALAHRCFCCDASDCEGADLPDLPSMPHGPWRRHDAQCLLSPREPNRPFGSHHSWSARPSCS